MGHSITAEKGERLDANRREGRLCSHYAGRGGCATRATVLIDQDAWTYRIDEGPKHTEPLPMCARHARQYPVGMRGVNFIVTGQRRF